jgi:hypothetical protein
MSVMLALTCSRIEDARTEPAGWSPRREDLLPLWLSRHEAEAVLRLCAVSPEFVGDAAEEALFGKLGKLLRAFRR